MHPAAGFAIAAATFVGCSDALTAPREPEAPAVAVAQIVETPSSPLWQPLLLLGAGARHFFPERAEELAALVSDAGISRVRGHPLPLRHDRR
jgi:hypothetical protein